MPRRRDHVRAVGLVAIGMLAVAVVALAAVQVASAPTAEGRKLQAYADSIKRRTSSTVVRRYADSVRAIAARVNDPVLTVAGVGMERIPMDSVTMAVCPYVVFGSGTRVLRSQDSGGPCGANRDLIEDNTVSPAQRALADATCLDLNVTDGESPTAVNHHDMVRDGPPDPACGTPL